jgi:exosortase
MTSAAAKAAPKLKTHLGGAWPLVVGFVALAIPTLINLAQKTWSYEDGAQGPILLATGAWLLYRERADLQHHAEPGASWIAASLLTLAFPLYIIGAAFDIVTCQALGLYLVGLAMLQTRFGVRALLATWFPLLYLGFTVPPPSHLVAYLTLPLKQFVAYVSTTALSETGLPVTDQGVTITVAQYQLLVENACSGMNSLIGLTAISLLYIYLVRRSSPIYALMLVGLVIPIAIVANIIRITIIILITYAFGDEVGQSFIHEAAGLVLFATSLMLVFSVDRGLFRLYSRGAGRR